MPGLGIPAEPLFRSIEPGIVAGHHRLQPVLGAGRRMLLQEQVQRPQGNTDEQGPDRAGADESAEDEPPATEPAGGK